MNKIAIVDIETTGFLNQGGLIVEVGIVSLDLDTGSVLIEYDSAVKESGFDKQHTSHPYGWIFKNSDLTFEEVMSSPSFNHEREKIQKILNRFPLGATAYNKQFDFGFLTSRELEIKQLPCAMHCATPVVNLPPYSGYITPKWPSVQESWDYFFGDTGYIERHRAADDAVHEAMIVYELYKKGAFVVHERINQNSTISI